MKRHKVFWFGVMLLVLCWSGRVFSANLPQYIREQMHSDIKYKLITEKNLDDIKSLKSPGEKGFFAVLQAKPESFNQEYADLLLKWVQEGGTLWFYDSRLAEYFGLKNSPLGKEEIKCQDHKGDYGTGRVDGINTIAQAYPFCDHPVVTGVQAIQVFLMEVSPGEYSAIADNTPGLIPIMAVNTEARAVVAIMPCGKGNIIFKPLLWNEVLGGERFQVNLMEFSAGYDVPRLEAGIIPKDALEGKPEKLPRYDSIMLSDGSNLIGMITDDKIQFMGDQGSMDVEVNLIESLEMDEMGAVMKMKRGGSHSGIVVKLDFNFKTITGKKIKISKGNITRIDFCVGQEKNPDNRGKSTEK